MAELPPLHAPSVTSNSAEEINEAVGDRRMVTTRIVQAVATRSSYIARSAISVSSASVSGNGLPRILLATFAFSTKAGMSAAVMP